MAGNRPGAVCAAAAAVRIEVDEMSNACMAIRVMYRADARQALTALPVDKPHFFIGAIPLDLNAALQGSSFPRAGSIRLLSQGDGIGSKLLLRGTKGCYALRRSSKFCNLATAKEREPGSLFRPRERRSHRAGPRRNTRSVRKTFAWVHIAAATRFPRRRAARSFAR